MSQTANQVFNAPAGYPSELSRYWAWNDPRWGERAPGQYAYDKYWQQLLKATGFDMGRAFRPAVETVDVPTYDGEGYYTGTQTVTRPKMGNPGGFTDGSGTEAAQVSEYTPEYYKAIDDLRAAGYDVRQIDPDADNYNTYFGILGPGNRVISADKVKGNDLGTLLDDMATFAPMALAAYGAASYLPGLLGGGEVVASAASPVTATVGEGLLSGVAEGMVPGGLSSVGIPATAAELAAVQALNSGAPGLSGLDAGANAYPSTGNVGRNNSTSADSRLNPNLLKYGLPLAGAAFGAAGQGQTQTSTRDMDPRLANYVYGADGKSGLLGTATKLFNDQMATGGLNELQRQGIDLQKNYLMNPAYAQGYTNMLNIGQGLLGAGVASNPFRRG